MYSSVKTIKANAREKLLSCMWTAVFFTVNYLIITNLCSFCLMIFPGGGSIAELLIYEISVLIINLFTGLFQMGVAAFYLNATSEDRRCSLLDLFYAFTHGPDKALKVTLFLSILQMLCSLPYVIYTLFIMPAYTMNDLLAMEPSVIESMGIAYLMLGAGELLYFVISLNYAPVYFMLVDMPELSAKKALKMSVWLMKGSKARLLWLRLSFLPLEFVSLLTFGLGNLWVTPYMNAASACFYTDLSSKRANQ